MSFFWPTNIKPAPGAVARLGRVLHWISLLLAIAALVTGVVSVQSQASYQVLSFHLFWNTMGPVFMAAVGIALFGRGLRYILSGE